VLDGRKRRIAENEARFRAINDRVAHDVRDLTADGEHTEFICECGNPECAQSLALTLDEYRRVREDALLFAVVPGHEIPDAEDVLSTTDRYVVVRKHVEAAPIVEEEGGRG
jgi:hypothetical protein